MSSKKGNSPEDNAQEDNVPNAAANQNIKVLERRDYLIRHGWRDEFTDSFEDNFVESQNSLGGYILGQ